MGIHRSALRRRRRTDAAATKVRNNVDKSAERARRDERMVAKIKDGSLPFAPAVMSWLSRSLDKKSSRITQDDVKRLIS